MSHHVRYLTGALGKQMRPKVIELRGLTIIQQQRVLLHDMTFEVFEGEAVAILGPSAEEKQALIACLLGQLPPDQGEIGVLGKQLPPLPPETRRRIGMMPQKIERAKRESVAGCLRRFAAYYGVQLTPAQMTAYCARYRLAPEESIDELTNIEARILALALALVHDPHLALLIEPLSGLNEREQNTMRAYLQSTLREGRTLLCTFTPPLAEKHVTGYDVVVRLEQGRLLRQET